MAELSMEQLIKIIVGLIVIVVVIAGVALFFKNNIFSFFSFESPVQKNQGSQQQNQINPSRIAQEPANKCSECGNGAFNLCDEDECISFGKCKFLDRIGPINECTDV